MEKISAVMIVYNEEKLIKRCLESIKDIANEIIIVHDGPCKDNTLKICRKYTKKVYEDKVNYGLPGPRIPSLFKKAKGPWILKIDADEFLSKDLKKNIKTLVENREVDAYSFRWPFWDGKKYVTKNWPRKTSLFRKSKISSFGFPHWDEPKINGIVKETDFLLEHRPYRNKPLFNWSEFFERGIKRYAKIQAEYTLHDFDFFDRFQWKEKDFPLSIKIRKKFPLLSSFPIGILAFFKTIFNKGAWREGKPVFIEAFQSIIYYIAVGYYIYKLKNKN